MNNIVIKCECCSEALEIEYDSEMDQIELSMWYYSMCNGTLSWKERIRWCYHILKTGNPWCDHIILNHKKMNDIIKWYTAIKKTDKQLLFDSAK